MKMSIMRQYERRREEPAWEERRQNKGFKSTTHDKTIYTKVHNGKTVYLLREAGEFVMACNEEYTVKELYKIIGSRLRLLNETKDSFTYLGLITDFKGIDVEQSQEYVQIACANYIDRICTSHGWDDDKLTSPASKPITPLPMDTLHTIGTQTGPVEGGPLRKSSIIWFGYP